MSTEMRRTFCFARAMLIASVVATVTATHAADPPERIYGVYNESSLGSLAVAPGSNMLIFSGGFPVGPPIAQTSVRFPLVTMLAGTSVRVTVNGISLDAYILGAEAQWVRALLPSSTPIGDGQLVVTYDGRTSVPYRLTVRERGFGIYGGGWCGPTSAPSRPSFCVDRAVQNIDAAGNVSTNSLVAPARPGQLVTLWGTGLGFASGDEAAGPIPGQLRIAGLQVLFGGRPAKIVYSGRSGCCAGMDEIIFEVPLGIEGCNVPVWVRYTEDGSASGDVFVSVASGTRACSDPDGLSESEVRKLSAGNLKAAEIWFTTMGSYWSANFGKASQTGVIAFGSCGNIWGEGFAAMPDPGSQFNAGATLNFQMLHGGTFTATRSENGYYNGPFDSPPEPGEYRLDNGQGGPALGPFQASFSIPDSALLWTNRDEFGAAKSDGLTVSWSVADPAVGHIEIYGSLAVDGETNGSTVFTCAERPDKGSFSIPASVLERAGVWSGFYNEFRVSVIYLASKRLSIPGLDFAEFLVFNPAQTTVDPRLLVPTGRH